MSMTGPAPGGVYAGWFMTTTSAPPGLTTLATPPNKACMSRTCSSTSTQAAASKTAGLSHDRSGKAALHDRACLCGIAQKGHRDVAAHNRP